MEIKKHTLEYYDWYDLLELVEYLGFDKKRFEEWLTDVLEPRNGSYNSLWLSYYGANGEYVKESYAGKNAPFAHEVLTALRRYLPESFKVHLSW